MTKIAKLIFGIALVCSLVCANVIKADDDQHERVLIMVKPDGVQRGLIGNIINRCEQRGLKLVSIKFMTGTEDQFKENYAKLSDKPFFSNLVKYMASGPVIPMVWEGVNAVEIGRALTGATNPKDATPGSIRGDLSISITRNVIHCASSVESANKEISIWFKPEELVSYDAAVASWINGD